jgi:hypothetical protein
MSTGLLRTVRIVRVNPSLFIFKWAIPIVYSVTGDDDDDDDDDDNNNNNKSNTTRVLYVIY